MFSRVIVKKPGKSYVNGLTTSQLGKPDYAKAMEQHEQYVNALKKSGVKVIELEANEQFPDSTFVEDTAIVTEKCAIITNPGAESRKGEIIEMNRVLSELFDSLEYIKAPGTLEGGDVLQVENHFYIGLSKRTNKEGATQLKAILQKYGYNATIVPIKHFFHLKTGISYLGNRDLVVAGEWIHHKVFKNFNYITVDEDEEYAANCIRIKDVVIVPKGFDKTKQKITNAGYSVIELDMSEFEKQDGGLSCLSLRF